MLAARRMMNRRAVSVFDDFNRADDPSTLGSGWASYVPENNSMGSGWGVYADEAYQDFFGNNAIPVPPDQYFGFVYRTDFTSPNFLMQFTFAYLHQGVGQPYYGTDQYAGGGFRMADNVNPIHGVASGYRFTINKLQRFDSGAPTDLVTWATPFVVGDIVKVVASGSSVEIYKNGSSIHSFTDSFYASNPRHGIADYPQSPPNGILADTNRYDDFTLREL